MAQYPGSFLSQTPYYPERSVEYKDTLHDIDRKKYVVLGKKHASNHGNFKTLKEAKKFCKDTLNQCYTRGQQFVILEAIAIAQEEPKEIQIEDL